MNNAVVWQDWSLSFTLLFDVLGMVSWILVLIFAAAAALILYSGCISADSGEIRNRSDLAFFAAGILMPYVSPFYLVRLIPPKSRIKSIEDLDRFGTSTTPKDNINSRYAEIKRKYTINRKKKILEAGGALEDLVDEITPEEEPEVEDASYTLEYFSSIPADADGLRQGPFALHTANGGSFDIKCIRKLYPDRGVFVLEPENPGDEERSVRLKFDQIEYFEKIDKDNEQNV